METFEEKKMELTDKEKKAFKAVVDNDLWGMGGDEPKDLFEDNYSWFSLWTISEAGFSKHEASGLMSSLDKKGLVYEADTPDWAMTDPEGIDEAQKLFEAGWK